MVPNAIAGNPGGVPNVISVPNFSRSFTVSGETFPYTMVGNDPSLGHITTIPTKIVAVSLRLLNADGTLFDTVDAGEFVQPALNSPNFQRFKYEHDGSVGIPGEPTQFSDAIQRAEFASSMQPNWHTELNPSSGGQHHDHSAEIRECPLRADRLYRRSIISPALPQTATALC